MKSRGNTLKDDMNMIEINDDDFENCNDIT